jgi:hypothetical protein
MIAIVPPPVSDHQFEEDHLHLAQEDRTVHALQVQIVVMIAFLVAQVHLTGDAGPLLLHPENQNDHLPGHPEAIPDVPPHKFIQVDWPLFSRHQDLDHRL